MLDLERQIFAAVFALLTCGYAIWRGGTPERVGGGVVLAGWLLSPLVQDREDWDAPAYALLVVDVAVLAVLVALALRSGRRWPMWAAGIHLAGVLSHLMVLLSVDVAPRAYYAMIAFGGYFVVLALVLGTVIEVELPRARLRQRSPH